eukprot:403351771
MGANCTHLETLCLNNDPVPAQANLSEMDKLQEEEKQLVFESQFSEHEGSKEAYNNIGRDAQNIIKNIHGLDIIGSMKKRRHSHKCEVGMLSDRDYCRYICFTCQEMNCNSKELAQHFDQHNHSLHLDLTDKKIYCIACKTNPKLPGDKNGMQEIEKHIDYKVEDFKNYYIKKRMVKTNFKYKDLIDGLVKKKFKRIVVLTGAGISVSAGIPDFRSPGSGVYANLAKYNLPFPEAIFTLDYFKINPEAFYTFCQSFDMDTFKPTPTHYFLVLLDKMGVLHMNFTQNIDALEEKAGMNVKEKLLQAHGTVKGARCALCQRDMDEQVLKEHIKKGVVYRCSGPECNGPVKPNIVLFGEAMPKDFFKKYQKIQDCDLVLVMGTALAVSPFNTLVSSAPKDIPKVLINRENTVEHGYDFTKGDDKLFLQGDCDEIIKKIIKDCRWEKDFKGIPRY